MKRNEAKVQGLLLLNISRKNRFRVGIIRVGEVCHHSKTAWKLLLWGPRATKKMKKVLNEISENYHQGIKSQILAFLSDNKETRSTVSGIVSHVNGARQKVNAELSVLVKAGKIEKVKRGVCRLPHTSR